jgi:hypothetical protein
MVPRTSPPTAPPGERDFRVISVGGGIGAAVPLCALKQGGAVTRGRDLVVPVVLARWSVVDNLSTLAFTGWQRMARSQPSINC